MNHRILSRACATVVLGLSFLAPAAHAATLTVDRGLPAANLNSQAGASRSNVGWDFQGYGYFAGDDFAIPAGKDQVIEQVRFWINTDSGGAASANNNDDPGDDPAYALSDTYTDLAFYLGPAAAGTTPLVAAGSFIGGNATDNPDIAISRVQYGGADGQYDYQGSSGSFAQLFEVTISNLNVVVQAGTSYQFGAECRGTGDSDNGTPSDFSDDLYHLCFMHSTNAALAGSPQDGADDLYRFFFVDALAGPASAGGTLDSNGFGWDKSSDANIQVWSSNVVPAPATFGLLVLGLLASLVRRR